MSKAYVDDVTTVPVSWSQHARFAIYYAPSRASEWWAAGSAWLGRDAEREDEFEAVEKPSAAAYPGDEGPVDGGLAAAAYSGNEQPADGNLTEEQRADEYRVAEHRIAERRAGEAPPYEAHAPHPQLSGALADLTAAPRRYGWHGTLVAPFRLADGVRPDDLLGAVQRWARTRSGFALPVDVTLLGDFVALRPASDEGDALMRGLAADAMRTFAPLRAAPTAAELERRLAGGRLTERQRALLVEWGYPYVFDEFRFHMTLSNSLASAHDCVAMVDWWQREAERLGPLPVQSVALFVEPAPGEPFVLWRRLAFRTAEA
ncbi:hypothetical protein GCM10027093_17800 [Paraburkholderia jirisanensis]